MGAIGSTPTQQGPIIPPLDQEQEYEWKWRVSHFSSIMIRNWADGFSQRWKFRGELSFCSFACISCMYIPSSHHTSSVLYVIPSVDMRQVMP